MGQKKKSKSNKRKSLSEETLLKLHQRMLKECFYRKHPQPEEIANTYVCRLLEGLHKKATVSQAYIDIVRSLHPGNRGSNSQISFNLNNGHFTKPEVTDSIEDHKDLNNDDLITLNQILNKIKNKKVLLIFKLRLQGFTNGEIADDLGITESRIHQLFQIECDRLKTILSSEIYL